MGAGAAMFGTGAVFNFCSYTVDAGERAIIMNELKGL